MSSTTITKDGAGGKNGFGDTGNLLMLIGAIGLGATLVIQRHQLGEEEKNRIKEDAAGEIARIRGEAALNNARLEAAAPT